MSYTPTNWVQGSTPGNATNMNHLETQYQEASLSFNPDVFTSGFVLSGLIASKDGTTATQLDVTAGTAYVLQSADSTPRQRKLVSSTQTTSAVSSTYYLYLQPDGTWYWSTSNAPATNSLAICQVTTDTGGNIATVTDKRTTAASLLPGMVGSHLTLPSVGGLNAFGPQAGQYAGVVYGTVTTGQAGALAGDSNASMQFDGSSGWISAGDGGLPTGNASWTLECWVKLAAQPTAYAACVRIGTDSANGSATLGFNPSGYPYTGFDGGSAATGTAQLSLNTWHHLVGTYSGTAITLYADGVQIAINSSPSAGAVGTSGMSLGAAVSGGGNFFAGYLDEAAVYSSTLSLTRIQAHYTAGHAGSNTSTYAGTVLSDSPLRYYRLGDTSGRGAANTTAEHAPVVASDGSTSPTYVAAVGGQPTAGPFGVPVIVAQAVDVHVTNTTIVDQLTYAAPATGLYRISMTFTLNNSVSGQAIAASWNYHDGNTGTSTGTYFVCLNNTSMVVLSGTVSLPNGSYSAFAPPFYAQAGTNIFASYNDPGGTPNDYVTFIVERMA